MAIQASTAVSRPARNDLPGRGHIGLAKLIQRAKRVSGTNTTRLHPNDELLRTR